MARHTVLTTPVPSRSTVIRPSWGLMVLGVLAVGVSGFVVLGTGDRTLSAVGALPLSVLWTASNVISPALLLPIEQELARSVAHGAAGDEDYRPRVRRITTLTMLMVAGFALVCALFHRALADILFSGDQSMVTYLVLIFAAFAGQHISRGIFAGTQRMTRYGLQLLTDGLLRAGLAVAVAATGHASVEAYGLILAIAPAVSVLITVPANWYRRIIKPGPGPAWTDIGSAVGLLIATQAASSLVIGGGAVAARALATRHDLPAAADLIATLILARAPLLAFYAIQPALIPSLVHHARLGAWPTFRRNVRRLEGAVLIIGLTGILISIPTSPLILRLVYGPQIHASAAEVVAALTGVVLFVAATILSQTLTAIRAYRPAAAVWVSAAAVYLTVLLLTHMSIEVRVLSAFLTAATYALISSYAIVNTSVAKHSRTVPPHPRESPPFPR
jgi:O-antigen/teichoic acid export membrane protein